MTSRPKEVPFDNEPLHDDGLDEGDEVVLETTQTTIPSTTLSSGAGIGTGLPSGSRREGDRAYSEESIVASTSVLDDVTSQLRSRNQILPLRQQLGQTAELDQHTSSESPQSYMSSEAQDAVAEQPPNAADRDLTPSLPAKRNRDPRPGNKIRRTTSTPAKTRIPQEMQAQWRVGAAPSAVLTLSREENQIQKVLAQGQAFYTSMFEVFWGPRISSNLYIFDLDNKVELFRDSCVTATGLVAVGKIRHAEHVLHRILPSMDHMLQNPHPALYLILAELCLGLVKTPDDAFRDRMMRFVATRAQLLLGAEHPITTLLTLQLPQSQKEALGQRLWESLLPILARLFGPDHYQSSTQVFCHARNLASSGHVEEAVRMIEALIDRWNQIYGNNSLIVCYSKIELANILANTGSDLKAEFVISDALRSSDIIQAAEMKNEDCPASEKRHRESSIAFPKVAGFRTLGKLHKQRGNLAAAQHHYVQAMTIGRAYLGEDSAAFQLAQSELESVQIVESTQSTQQSPDNDPATITDIVGSPVC